MNFPANKKAFDAGLGYLNIKPPRFAVPILILSALAGGSIASIDFFVKLNFLSGIVNSKIYFFLTSALTCMISPHESAPGPFQGPLLVRIPLQSFLSKQRLSVWTVKSFSGPLRGPFLFPGPLRGPFGGKIQITREIFITGLKPL